MLMRTHHLDKAAIREHLLELERQLRAELDEAGPDFDAAGSSGSELVRSESDHALASGLHKDTDDSISLNREAYAIEYSDRDVN